MSSTQDRWVCTSRWDDPVQLSCDTCACSPAGRGVPVLAPRRLPPGTRVRLLPVPPALVVAPLWSHLSRVTHLSSLGTSAAAAATVARRLATRTALPPSSLPSSAPPRWSRGAARGILYYLFGFDSVKSTAVGGVPVSALGRRHRGITIRLTGLRSGVRTLRTRPGQEERT